MNCSFCQKANASNLSGKMLVQAFQHPPICISDDIDNQYHQNQIQLNQHTTSKLLHQYPASLIQTDSTDILIA